SYDLLRPSEQRLFEELSIFRGGCTLALATSVCAHDDVAPDAILDLLASLVEKSLLAIHEDGAEPRYVLAESSLDYAREKLAARNRWNEMAHRHALAYVKLAEQLEDASYMTHEARWRSTMEAESENWTAALEWTLIQRGDVALGLHLTAALRPFWSSVRFAEGRSWVRLAFERLEATTPPEIVARLEHAEAKIALRFSESQVALAVGRRALEHFRALGDRRAIAALQEIIGHGLTLIGRAAEAKPLFFEALQTARELGCRALVAELVESIANAHSRMGEVAEARAAYAEAETIFREVGDELDAAICAGNLAEAEFHAGDPATALHLAVNTLERYRFSPFANVGLYETSASANIAAYLIALDRFHEARTRVIEAVELAREQGEGVVLAWAMQHMAAITALQRDDGGEPVRVRHARAARLLGYVNARLTALGAPRQFTEQQEYDRVLDALRQTFDGGELAELMADGSAMREDGACEEAFGVVPIRPG
ncbi:MAG TPA: tetratricopeptide repeat protein, partial [Candidatus Acidoferrum sp.]|nr:tetratricopeptide repeat protein [Candidatus Acidoferrum sp.]